jgi:hypothetical protein
MKLESHTLCGCNESRFPIFTVQQQRYLNFVQLLFHFTTFTQLMVFEEDFTTDGCGCVCVCVYIYIY